ncbi:MAG: hypothetical protein PHE43_03490 [Candidatus Nanoarchaeia archaeon]|nr:hypothetical protein [Candidatus Nanoarchaeia archaeon]
MVVEGSLGALREEESKLERKIVNLIVDFAVTRELEYSIKSKNTYNIEKGDLTEIDIEMGDHRFEKIIERPDGRDFYHTIRLLNGNFDWDKTLSVSDSTRSRKNYLDFLEFMMGKGIPLVNDFQKLWNNDPGRYPIKD